MTGPSSWSLKISLLCLVSVALRNKCYYYFYQISAPVCHVVAMGFPGTIYSTAFRETWLKRTAFYLVADNWTHYAKDPRVNYCQTKRPSRSKTKLLFHFPLLYAIHAITKWFCGKKLVEISCLTGNTIGYNMLCKWNFGRKFPQLSGFTSALCCCAWKYSQLRHKKILDKKEIVFSSLINQSANKNE